MFNVVLYQPEIPPNTGNIIRLCANTGCSLHLIEPLGFELTDKHLKRAGLDYELNFPLRRYASFEEYLEQNLNSKLYVCSTKAQTIYSNVDFKPNDSFIFGPETRGLPNTILEQYPDPQKIKIPMQKGARSINLSNSVAIVVYEAWRQQEFSMV